MTREEMIEYLGHHLPLSACSKEILDLLKARCADCANAKCFYDREPVCSHFEPKEVEL